MRYRREQNKDFKPIIRWSWDDIAWYLNTPKGTLKQRAWRWGYNLKRADINTFLEFIERCKSLESKRK